MFFCVQSKLRNDIFSLNFEIIMHFTQCVTYQWSPKSDQVYRKVK